ncbi:MAG: hypothetical protein AB7F41_13610 [Methylocystis sp.]|uniref:hypothetical protein n=1 Tax=Methylocystis sp. TaxID=1911079 RepID=UPI003D12B594
MSDYVKSLAFMAAGLATMIVANFFWGGTLLGWVGLLAGIGVYYYGWRVVCPACRAQRCAAASAKPANAPSEDGVTEDGGKDGAAAR